MLNNALELAARIGRDDAARALLDAGANADTMFSDDNILQIVANNGRLEVIKVLYPATLHKDGQPLEHYLSIAEHVSTTNASQASINVPELGEESVSDIGPDSDDDTDKSLQNPLERSNRGWEMEDFHRWIERRDTLRASTTTGKQTQHIQKSNSSMGVYDDDSELSDAYAGC